MVEIQFNPFRNGACPFCKHSEDCKILKAMSIGATIISDESEKKDKSNVLEIVIYRCPEFEEKK